MTILVVDLECNGLYDAVDKIHCIVCKDVETGEVYSHYKGNLDYTMEGLPFDHCFGMFEKADKIIGHNFIDFDMRVIEKLCGVRLDVDKIIDTYLLSQMFDPHRRKWKQSKGGAHSLENWGYIVGRGKPSHDDWETFTPEMLHRCEEDVEITELVAQHLGVL